MSTLICRIPNCGVKILLKWYCCQEERSRATLWNVSSNSGEKKPPLIMKHWTRPLHVLGSSPFFPPLSLSPPDSRPCDRGSRGRKGWAGGETDNKGIKATALPTAKLLSMQQRARQAQPSQALHPHQPWQTAGRTIILTIWLCHWPHTEMGQSLQLWLVLLPACHWR